MASDSKRAAAERPRLLVVTRNLPPLRGGMERLNYHVLEELAREFEVRVCCPRDCAGQLPESVAGSFVALKPLSRFVLSSAAGAVGLALRFRPRLVLAGSGLTAPAALLAARACGAKAGAYLHGLDVLIDNPVYQHLWVPRLRALDLVIANSRATAQLAAGAGVAPERIRIIHPGAAMPAIDLPRAESFRSCLAIGQRPLLLSVGRLTERKGLPQFLESAMPAVVAAIPDILFAIVGTEAVDSLKRHRGSERQRIEAAVARLHLGDNVRLLGALTDAELDAAFYAASALAFPVIAVPGDIEGFGMVAVEAAAHGVPTVAFDVGGINDAVADGVSGVLCAPGDYGSMARALIAAAGERSVAAQRRAQCRNFAEQFAWPKFGERIREACRKAVGG
jgi:phosphatidylinositol alpha-1,6-mannosyltransferase